MSQKHIYFVRHGQTEGNLGKFFQFPDTPLTQAGHEGAQALADRFASVSVDALYSSTFTRAQQTASYVSNVKNIPVISLDYFHEKRHARTMQGVLYHTPEGRAYKQTHTQKFWTKDWDYDGAETYFDVIQRAQKGLQLLEEENATDIVVVAHADFIRTITAYLLSGKSDDSQYVRIIFYNLHPMSNVGISQFVYKEGTWSLLHWNDYAHFAE